MHTKSRWEDRIIPSLKDNLVMVFTLPITEDINKAGGIVTEVFWKKTPAENYFLRSLDFHSIAVIQHTFSNNIRIKGTLRLENMNIPNSNDTMGIWADFKYYDLKKETYVWHTEGFLISFNPGKEREKEGKESIPDDIILDD